MRTALPLPCELEGYRVARDIMSKMPSSSLACSKENYKCASGSGDKAQRQFIAGRGREGRCVGGHESSFQSSDDFYEIHSKRAPFDVTAD